MEEGIARAFALSNLLFMHKKISVRRIMGELDIPQSSIYRLLTDAEKYLPIRIKCGIVYLENGRPTGSPLQQ
jgi:predicted transcriptional regulator